MEQRKHSAKYKIREKVRDIPEPVGEAAVAALKRIDYAKKRDELWIKKIKAIELCYVKHMSDNKIASNIDSRESIDERTVALWFRDILGPESNKENIQEIEKAVHVIEGMASACFSFEDVYNESTRHKYIDGMGIHKAAKKTPKNKYLKQGKREFLSLALKAGINIACFEGKDGKLHFNEDGKELAIAMLNYRTHRKKERQDGTIFRMYQDIRLGRFRHQHWQYYEWMIQKACSNLRDLKKVYPDYVIYNEDDIREAFWKNTCRWNNGFAAFPGIGHLGDLPQQLSANWTILFDDFLFLDSVVLNSFANFANEDDIEIAEKKECWINILLCVLEIREYDRARNEANQKCFSPTELAEIAWLKDFLTCYENKLQDEYECNGISLAKEEKWASREIAEDKRLRTNFDAMKRSLEKNILNEDSDGSKAARVFTEWMSKIKSLPNKLSTEDVLSVAITLVLNRFVE